MNKLSKGDRVELTSSNIHGTVEYADKIYVRVCWDDGKDGLLYYDGSVIANANHLVKLRMPPTEKEKTP
jgi:hypothetical protein